MTPSNFSEKKNFSELSINKSKTCSNRGVDLLLNGGKKRPKSFQIRFEKMVCFFKREVTINFEFSLNLRKKRVSSQR